MSQSQGAVSNDTMMDNIEEIMNLARGKSRDKRGKLDSALADILKPFTPEEYAKRHEAAKVIHHLLRKAAVDIREMLAQRLAVEESDKIPAQLLLALANDEEISVAKPVLLETKIFDDQDWGFIINSTNPSHWQMIAKRHDLSDHTINLLINQKDNETAVVLLNNHALILHKEMVAQLGRQAFSGRGMHEPLLARQEIDMKVATELYWSASQTLRTQIIERFNIDKKTVDKALEGILQELMNVVDGDHTVTDDIALMAKRYGERREISTPFLTKILRNGQVAFFVALFAEYTNLSVSMVRDMLIEENGDSFATVCRAKGIMKSDFASYFLMTRVVRPGDKKVNQGELSAAMAKYDTIKREEATELLNKWIAKE